MKNAADPPSRAVKEEIRQQALAAGFVAVGFARPEAPDGARARLQQFIAENRHGDMGWMATRLEERADPLKLWREARTIIMLAANYGPDGLAPDEPAATGTISLYARNRDYHDTLKKRLKALGRWMAERYGGQIKIFVDTAPVMEKPLAQQAGLGWQGKHTNLVSRQWGSWLFLCEIFTSLEIAPDGEESDHCGECRSCIDACPTRAITAPYTLDARLCISYLTIEHKGSIARALRGAMGNRIYGCDDCLAVCPWNKFAQATTEADFRAREELKNPDLAFLLSLDEAQFRALFSKSPVKRTGRERFIRNVLIAAGNSRERALVARVVPLLRDPSALLRATAVWALSRLEPESAFAARRKETAATEKDESVLEEWRAAP